MNDDQNSKRLVPLLMFLFLAAAAFLRMQNFFSALEYDEIWTLENFSVLPLSKLFTELALPNNQPMNSLWVRFVSRAGLPLWSIRLHSMAAGLLTLPLAGFISYHLSGKKIIAALGSIFFLTVSAPDICYAAQARGYALQVFFLALYAAGLTAGGFSRPSGKIKQYLPECAVFIGGAGAVLTLPTSVLYLTAITLAAWVINRKLPRRSMLVTLGTGAILTLLWCLSNYQQLDAARSWGTRIGSAADFFNFLKTTGIYMIGPAAFLTGCAAFAALPRKTLPLLLILIIPLVSAPFSNGGPPRTYIPFGTVLAVAAGCGISVISQRLKTKTAAAVCILLALLCVWEYSWRRNFWPSLDSWEIFKESSRQPLSTLVVHSSTAGYPLVWNNRPHAYNDFIKRLLEHSQELIMFDGPGRINGMDPNGGESVLAIRTQGAPEIIAGKPCRRYKLIELNSLPEPGTAILVVLRPVPQHVYSSVLKTLAASGITWLKLNFWFCCPLNRPEATYRYSLLAGTIPQNTAADWNAFISSGMLSIYKLADPQ